jgi:hypothetical protein
MITANKFMRNIGCRRIWGFEKKRSTQSSGTRAAAHTVPMMSRLREGSIKAMNVTPGGRTGAADIRVYVGDTLGLGGSYRGQPEALKTGMLLIVDVNRIVKVDNVFKTSWPHGTNQCRRQYHRRRLNELDDGTSKVPRQNSHDHDKKSPCNSEPELRPLRTPGIIAKCSK